MITRAFLEAHAACVEHIDIFVRRWANGVDVTLESLAEAKRLGLNIFWLENVLPDEAREQFRLAVAPASEEYRRAWVWTAAARASEPWEDHEGRRAAAQAEFERVKIAALVAAFKAT